MAGKLSKVEAMGRMQYIYIEREIFYRKYRNIGFCKYVDVIYTKL